jgi:Rrf2 family iron-sulfur cluster assembly transcriptional regulator
MYASDHQRPFCRDCDDRSGPAPGQGTGHLSGISQRQAISLSYLEQLFGKLRRHEIVESIRGPGGGYSLARRADKVTVADIIIAVDEPLDATQCGGKENCHGADAARARAA